MDKFMKWVDRILSNILIVLMAVIVLDVSWQVFTRYILPKPSSYTEELATYLLIWIGLLGASYALRTKSHLGIDILTMRLKGAKKCLVEIIVYLSVFCFSLFIMVIGGMRLVILTFTLNQISAALQIKMGYVYLVIPLSGVLIMLYSVDFIRIAVCTWMGKISVESGELKEKLYISLD